VSVIFEHIDKQLREEHVAVFAAIYFADEKQKKTTKNHIGAFTNDFLRRKLSTQKDFEIPNSVT
jgi:hypothetical protein